MWFQDVFCDHVFGHGPEFAKHGIAGPAQAAQVVDERVKPDIGHEFVIKGQRDAPGQAGPKSRTPIRTR